MMMMIISRPALLIFLLVTALLPNVSAQGCNCGAATCSGSLSIDPIACTYTCSGVTSPCPTFAPSPTPPPPTPSPPTPSPPSTQPSSTTSAPAPTPAPSSGGRFAVATFTDNTCSTLSSSPSIVTGGVCTYSSGFQTYFQVSSTGSYSFQCTSGCGSCLATGQATFGACTNLGNTGTYGTAWALDQNSPRLSVTVYSDASCLQRASNVKSFTVQSGSCQYVDAVGSTAVVANTMSGTVLFAYNCNADCTDCNVYGTAVSIGSCANLGGGLYATALYATSSSSALSAGIFSVLVFMALLFML